MRTHEENKGRVWQLMLGGELITEIVQTGYEFPWTYGDVSDIARFDVVRPYFRDPDDWPDDARFATLVETIRQSGGFILRDTRDTTDYASFTLHAGMDDASASVWFRHNAVEELDAESDTDDDQ